MRSSVLSIAALAAVAAAADELPNADVGALEALFQDINSYRDQYIDYLASASAVSFPTGLIDIYTAMTTYTDDGYTSLFKTIPLSEFSEIHALATALPWYSTRLLPAAEADASKIGGDSSAATTAASSKATSSAAASSAASSVAQNSTESSFKNRTSSSSASGSSSVKLTSVSKSASSASETASASESESSAASTSASSSSSAAAAINAVPFAGLSLGAVAYMLL
ncbi:TIP1 [Brettanomyces bruxellensis]|uniref:DEBR0S7_00276g1_1 n=1 Tax=Dekkera bruxellensis TaxID=5007 RepID=A0A7D9H337_DEKBR|nr:TIP1 [Brettanomyces bruxellensis]